MDAEHEGLVELFSQLGSIVSEPTHSWDSSKHHVAVLEFVPRFFVVEVEELRPPELEIEVFDFKLEFEEPKLELHSH